MIPFFALFEHDDACITACLVIVFSPLLILIIGKWVQWWWTRQTYISSPALDMIRDRTQDTTMPTQTIHSLWQRYNDLLCTCDALHLSLDISRINFDDAFLDSIDFAPAFAAMEQLEAGVKVNADELDDHGEPGRMVGHYWLRNPDQAPDELVAMIRETIDDIKTFVAEDAKAFTDVLIVGIGGSALGPQLVADALGNLPGRPDQRRIHFLDNTDPDGIDRVFCKLKDHLDQTLVVVISKSGGTPETRNGMRETQKAFDDAGVDFAKHAVAVTGVDSALHQESQNWRAQFPMCDWVGGRTSVTSAVGLLPAALQGIDIDALLAGAAEMDVCTRQQTVKKNPAALLALMWYHEVKVKRRPNMVILPYKDRLLLFSRYLQQLIMESLGKEFNTDKTETVHEGISVYGNKGSTDQHAYVQQLRDGVHDFFATFIVAQKDRAGDSIAVDKNDATSGDYLHGFWQGTRQALYESGRGSVTITIDDVTPRSLGGLIALYERAVGFYATLIDVNAYHQPGVEAGKKAAGAVLALQTDILAAIDAGVTPDPATLAEHLSQPDEIETIHHVLAHLKANGRI